MSAALRLALGAAFLAAAARCSFAVRPSKDEAARPVRRLAPVAAVRGQQNASVTSQAQVVSGDGKKGDVSASEVDHQNASVISKVQVASGEGKEGGVSAGEVDHRALTASVGQEGFHMAKVGEQQCEFGVSVGAADCHAAGNSILAELKIKPGRHHLVDANVADEMKKSTPRGCSINVLGDFAVVFNPGTDGENDGNFALVCSGDKEAVHLAHYGKSVCDYGVSPGSDKCYASAKKLMDALVAEGVVSAGNIAATMQATRSSSIPFGCSIATRGDFAIHWNTNGDAKSDGSHSLVCSGTAVPLDK